MAKYRLEFDKQYLKDLEKIPKTDRGRVAEAVESLAHDPRPDGCKKLKGQKGPLYRIRCGNYRIVYCIEDSRLLVLVVRMGHRQGVYL